jgi:hypothetical protein
MHGSDGCIDHLHSRVVTGGPRIHDPVPDVSLQTVVAIDPSGTSDPSDKSDIKMKPKNDEIGIIASLGKDQSRFYLP